MAQEAALRTTFSQMETDFLVKKWQTEEHLPWAEDILRDELLGRGLSPSALDKAKNRKERLLAAEGSSVKDPVPGYWMVRRFVAIVTAIAASSLFRGLFNADIGYIAAAAVLLVYAVDLLYRMMKHDGRGGFAGLFETMLQLFEVTVIFCGSAYFAYVMLSKYV